MSKMKVIDVNVGIYEENIKIADEIRKENKKKGTFLVNMMASPGAGKTTTLLRTIEMLKEKPRFNFNKQSSKKKRSIGLLRLRIVFIFKITRRQICCRFMVCYPGFTVR